MNIIDTIRTGLGQGKTVFGPIKVSIDTGGIGGRYRAFIQTPDYNTMVETPDTVNKEGILSFYDRLTPALAEEYVKYY